MAINIQNIPQQTTTEKQAGKNESASVQLGNFLNRDINLFGSGLSDKNKEALYSELYALLSSGVDIKSSLEIVVEEQKKDKQKTLYNDILDQVLNGATLSEAMRSKKEFSAYEYHSMRIGEETGQMNKVLKEIASYYNKRLRQKKQITGALTYPVLVLFTAVGAVIFMMNFIVPMFSGVFERFGGELPGITQMIVDLSEAVSEHIGVIFLIIMLLVIVYVSVRKKRWYRRVFSPLILKLPFIGKLINKIYLVRYCQSMALLISSRTPLVQAVDLVREMIRFYPYESALYQIRENLMQGGMLHDSMSAFTIFNRRVISLVKVGEEINQLDDIFEKLSRQYNEELEHQIGMINNLLEPVMILFVGILVAVILIAMYLPLFQLSTSFY